MAIHYHVYANDYAGGPVNVATPVATASGLTYTPAAIPASSDVTFLLRAFDTVTGLEESNIAATYRLVTDASGNNITDRPAPIVDVTARAIGTTARVAWGAIAQPDKATRPAGFHVYKGTPTVSYGAVAATVPYTPGVAHYTVDLPGLTSGSTYQFAVRPYNATGECPTSPLASCVPSSAAPAPPESGGSRVSSSPATPTDDPPTFP